MRTLARTLLRACLLVSVPICASAQTEPVVVEAESGTIGASFNTVTANGVTYITINSTDATNPPVPARLATYSVTFPAAGQYELYARFRVGPDSGNDDSFFLGNGFSPTTFANANQVDNGGYTLPQDTVRNGGPATNNVYKWFKLSGFVGPAVWNVPAGALTQTFVIGGREDGNFIDKFAFGLVGSYYTVSNLDTGTAASGTPPPPDPPAYTRTGPALATGKAKFLGSAWSGGVNGNNLNFGAYWNQVTPENGGKWASVEGTRDVYNFADARNASNQAAANGSLFKWHVLFWGNQQPNWMWDLPPAEQLEEIHEWLQAIATEFPDLQQIEVVNEPLHDRPDKTSAGNTTAGGGSGGYYEALGGAGATGHDWIINAFTLARQYFPNAKLMLNDYSITNDGNATTNYLTIINLLKERNLIDLVGVQGHAFEFGGPTSNSAATHRANLTRLQAAGLPIYVTEFDLDGNDDPVQLEAYQRLFPVFWEHEAVKGITMWGYTRNGHWRRGSGAWLMYMNGAERPALQWLVAYVTNTPATVTAGQSFNVSESAAGGTAIGTVLATDVDAGTTLSQWQLTDATGKFAIDAGTGALSLAPGATLDFEAATSYSVSVSVWDGYTRSAASVAIEVTNVNDNVPSVSAGQTFDIDSGYKRTIAWLESSDPDDMNQLGFTTFQDWQIVSGNPGSVFRVTPSAGELQIARPLLIDWRKTSYSLVTTVSDGANTSAPTPVTVVIPKRVDMCLFDVIRLEVPKASAPLVFLLGGELGSCFAPL